MANLFYAQKDALGFPIPGTMMSVPESVFNGEVPEGAGVNVSAYVYDVATEPNGRVLHPEGLRYFVRTDNAGNIVSNSLIISLEKPAGSVLEFKLTNQ